MIGIGCCLSWTKNSAISCFDRAGLDKLIWKWKKKSVCFLGDQKLTCFIRVAGCTSRVCSENQGPGWG